MGWGSDVRTLLQVTKLRMHTCTSVDVHLCHVSLGWCFTGDEGKPQLINPLDTIYIKVTQDLPSTPCMVIKWDSSFSVSAFLQVVHTCIG